MAPPAQPQVVLVTGISGYLGSNVAYQLLQAGYAVRGTARGNKLKVIQESVGKHYPLLELVEVGDIFRDDLTEVLKGVNAVIHVATALPGADDSITMIKGGVEGTLHLLNQAYNAGIKKFVLTSSFASLIEPDFQAAYTDITLNETNWGTATLEEALVAGKDNPLYAYCATKLLAERTAWKFAAEKPDFDLAAVLPVGIYGPFPPHFALPHPQGSTTFAYVYTLLNGQTPPQLSVNTHDVRDCALAHVRALQLPPFQRVRGATVEETAVKLQEKRFIASAGQFSWAQAAEYLREAHPELKDRIPVIEEQFDLPTPAGLKKKAPADKKLTPVEKVDTTRAKEVLGIDK
ncbi:hypothetical protein AX16_004906 [Volvariella volvacea WC 439]|nr:hypothetical protein AX16_004906 [Volvariella volvacea WC 439]